jgi:sugar phosphate isomerase/epimerase
MPRAFSTLGCPDLDFDAALALARAHALDGIEIRALEATTDLPALFAARYRAPAALADRMLGETMRVFGLGTSVRLLAPTDTDRAALAAYAPWAEALGAPFLRVFDGGERADGAELARAAGLLAWWREARDAAGWAVDLIVETHDAVVTADALARFCDALPDTQLLWDSHHTWRRGGADPVATWLAIARRVPHIHVKDSIDRPGPRLPYTYVPPGAGAFPMAALREALILSEYDGVLSLEWERMWHPDLPPLDAALASASERGWW